MYCTYLGIFATEVTLTGVAVASVGNAYLAGYMSNPAGTLPTINGFQAMYGGDPERRRREYQSSRWLHHCEQLHRGSSCGGVMHVGRDVYSTRGADGSALRFYGRAE